MHSCSTCLKHGRYSVSGSLTVMTGSAPSSCMQYGQHGVLWRTVLQWLMCARMHASQKTWLQAVAAGFNMGSRRQTGHSSSTSIDTPTSSTSFSSSAPSALSPSLSRSTPPPPPRFLLFFPLTSSSLAFPLFPPCSPPPFLVITSPPSFSVSSQPTTPLPPSTA
eukprot:1887677-Rhodomonas_salina.1